MMFKSEFSTIDFPFLQNFSLDYAKCANKTCWIFMTGRL